MKHREEIATRLFVRIETLDTNWSVGTMPLSNNGASSSKRYPGSGEVV